MRILRGSGLVLEPQIATHAAELYPLLSDVRLYTYIDDKGPVSEAALCERFVRLESRVSGDGTEQWLNWVIRTMGGKVAGYVQATVTADQGTEIAFVLGVDFWRQGIGRAACTLMLDELRLHHGALRATATFDPENVASLALLKSLGFGFFSEDSAAKEVTYRRAL